MEKGSAEIRVIVARRAALAALLITDAQYLQQTLAEGDLQLRLGLAESSAANIGVTGLRDRCSLALSKLFSDPEVAVRSAASDSFAA